MRNSHISMDHALQAENLGFGETVKPSTFSISPGGVAAILTPKEEINLCLTKLIIGLLRPTSGCINILNHDVATLAKPALLRLRQKIGVVYASGGLISNLKIWENLTLPLSYHSVLGREEIKARGVELLQQLRYSGSLTALPGPLTMYQKRLVGFARAMLNDPDIMIFESPCPGLNSEERNFLIDTALQYHRQKPGRTTLFITSNPGTLEKLGDSTIFQPYQG